MGTRILLDANGQFLAFGQPATNSYITMGCEKSDWMLFERFKMALYEKKDDDDAEKQTNDGDKGQLHQMLTAVNGKQYPSDKVFIEALKYIKSQVFKFFTKNKLQIENIDDIQWILTVPAIWSETAKYKMEHWAQMAGLTNKNIPNHLKIVYEPDCASLSIQYEIQKLKAKKEKTLSIMQASKKSEDPSPKIQKEEEDNNKEEKTEEVEQPELPSNESTDDVDNVK